MFGYELEPGIRLMNVHVISADAPELGRYLATRHSDDRLSYVAEKESFILARSC